MSPTSSSESRAPSPPADSKGTNISDGEYAEKVQRLIKLIDDLRSLGADAIIDLPGIVVIGNQSAGKSSLVEALSAISVPRNANTCTRSPMECRLKFSLKPWSCQIRLRRIRDVDANRKKKSREETFGPLLTTKSDLELMIRRAQLAILNPSIAISHFVEMSEQELDKGLAEGQVSFSSDVVCLDISGPDVTNLSFIDLPGIITYDEKDNITLIENMVKDHIKGNKLILLTITMREDIQLQMAAGLAKEADQNGARTIGVLTKPDTLQEGEEEVWLQVLKGEGIHGAKHKLHHGYFVTKQPALSELREKVSHAEARARERAFFESTQPWNSLPPRLQNRVGVPNLALELSRHLSRLIEKSFPDVLEKTHRSKLETQAALDAIPLPPPENPVIELSSLLSKFTNEFSKCIWGAQGHEHISQHCRRTYSGFSNEIVSTRPNFVPRQKTDNGSKGDSKNQRMCQCETIEEAAGLPCETPPMFLDELHKFLDGSLTRELPYNVPFSAKAKLIRSCFAKWDDKCIGCFNAVKLELSALLKDLVKKHFSQYARGGLELHVQRLIDSLVERCSQVTKDRIKWMLELEDPPFTRNDHDFTSYREKNLAMYKETRREHKSNQRDIRPLPSRAQLPTTPSGSDNSTSRAQQALVTRPPTFGSSSPNPNPNSNRAIADSTLSAHQDDVQEALAILARNGYPRLKEEDLAKLNDVDPFEQELIVMAEVSAYFRIAYKRIIDNIPRIIDHDFLRALEANIHGALNRGLGVGEVDAYSRAQTYLKEDPEIAASREELTRKKERLEEIVERLDKFYI